MRKTLEWASKFPNPERALDRLAAALFVNSAVPESRLMGMFSAYFDCSGNAKDQPFVVVAGYVANYLQWQTFEEEWRYTHEVFGVDLPFHMADFVAACRSPHYKDQRNARRDYVALAADPEKSRKFIYQLSGCQVANVHCGFSCIVDMDIYRQVDSAFDLRTVVPPYALGARMCIEQAHKWGSMFAIREFPELIFEEGDFEQGKFTELMSKEGLPLPIYKKKNDFAGLQAADQYAWEQTYALKEHKKGTDEMRDLFGWLIQGIPKLHVHAPLSFLVKLCSAKGIPLRGK